LGSVLAGEAQAFSGLQDSLRKVIGGHLYFQNRSDVWQCRATV
jgi:hypothetical protein